MNKNSPKMIKNDQKSSKMIKKSSKIIKKRLNVRGLTERVVLKKVIMLD